MNLLFPIKDFNLRTENKTFFEITTLSPGNYDDDIDQIIHSFLLDKEENTIDSFTIPISLSNNFMEFSGLLLAHHIRLSREFKFCDVPIVFYGSLKLEQLLRLTPLARILLTSNVFYVEISRYSFDEIQKSLEGHKTKLFDINTFLDQIQIKPPANYDSHHSVDNEFALIQWSKFINCYDELPPSFKKEYESKLYFKYLKLKQTLAQETRPLQKNTIVTTEKINILLIDDEAIKGWKAFYSSFFRTFSDNIVFQDSCIDFKNLNTEEEIISKIKSKIVEFKPDVILLDLRLLDSDFLKESLPIELTGFKILDEIKEINKGIQVIITTASNKAWNFNVAKQKGAYDFIIKDGFENPNRAIEKLIYTVEISAKRAKFLKEIGKRIDEIKKVIIGNRYFNSNDDKIRYKLFSNFNLSFELLDLSCEIPEKQKYFAYSYLQLFICIEEFLKIKDVFEFGDKCYINNSILVARKDPNNESWSASIKFIDNNPSHYILCNSENNIRLNPQQSDFKMSAVLIYLFNQATSNSKNWPIIRDIRNKKAAHPEKGNITQGNIIHLFDFLLFIFDVRNLILENFKDGLTDEIKVEDIDKLKNLYNK